MRSWGRHLDEQRSCPTLDARCREMASVVEERACRETDAAKRRQCFGQPKERPEVSVEPKHRNLFRLLIRDLELDFDPDDGFEAG